MKEYRLVIDESSKERYAGGYFIEEDNLIDFLYTLHKFNYLNNIVINSIEESLKIDVRDLCKKEGITWFVI